MIKIAVKSLLSVKRLATFLAGMTGVVLITGCAYQTWAEHRDLARFPPPGKLYEINGSKMHLYCRGSGDPTVLVEPGIWGDYWQWDHINQKIALTTRVCGYDRSGFGYSDYVQLQSVDDIATRLHALLQTADIKSSLILVGHSAGGIYVRNYYKHFPENVVGMVLVESSHENQKPEEIGMKFKINKYLAPLGVSRMLGTIRDEIERSAMPNYLKPRQIALYSQSHTGAAMVNESYIFNKYLMETKAPVSLNNLPLAVISRGKPFEAYEGVTPEYTEFFKTYLKKWDLLQKNWWNCQAMVTRFMPRKAATMFNTLNQI